MFSSPFTIESVFASLMMLFNIIHFLLLCFLDFMELISSN